jgi:hypothetical protein
MTADNTYARLDPETLDALSDRRHDFDIGSRMASVGTAGCKVARETLDALIASVRQLEMIVGDLTGPVAWYKSEKSPDYWFVTDFTHDQVEGLRAKYRALVGIDGTDLKGKQA